MSDQLMYKWKPWAGMKVDPQIAAREMLRVGTESADGLTPANLVDASRPEHAPLHPEFEWNDAVAAENFREQQASTMIRYIAIIQEPKDDEPERLIRAFWPVTDTGHRYEHLIKVLSDDDLKSQVLATAWKELESFRRKYADLKEFEGVISAISEVKIAVAG